MDGLALLEKTFEEIGINFTDKNQISVANLLKTMKLNEVVSYLKELYEGVKQDKTVNNIPALFSSKLEKGERIVKKVHETKINKLPEKNLADDVEAKIKKRVNYWLDYYAAFKNYGAAWNGMMADLSDFVDYPELCNKYYEKFEELARKGA